MARRPSRSRGSRSGGPWLFLLGLLVGAGVLFLYLHRSSPLSSLSAGSEEAPASPRRTPSRETKRPSPRDIVASDHVEPTPVKLTPVPVSSGPVHGARVAVVIDDLGTSPDELRPLEELGVPVTYSVLPYAEQTPQVVSELRGRNAEILLHLPMQPKNGENPGPGALLERMTDDELRQGTVAALKAVPGAVGVNNHMGSLLSSEEGPMNTVLEVIAERHLFFLDSRTSADSVGYKVATQLGIPAAERQVFLDGDPAPEAIRAQFQRLLALARTHGAAIAIGHPHPETLAMLASEVPKAKAEGYEFVPVSYLLTRAGGE
ncbi:MAG: uncharacterized protein QOF89_3972 [Acidobacteriota bacterium]|jgi:polysaccharide deacetylase 2 family uncharacterized protein YibQ|nr:uncharacterized protein [Acidobacteriota bacterium]